MHEAPTRRWTLFRGLCVARPEMEINLYADRRHGCTREGYPSNLCLNPVVAQRNRVGRRLGAGQLYEFVDRARAAPVATDERQACR